MLAGKIPDIEGKNVCCLVSGGNIDVTILSRVIERGLKMSGRKANITIARLHTALQAHMLNHRVF